MAVIDVPMGEIKMARDPEILSAKGIGSCIVITFYDPHLKIGTLAHTILPDSKEGIPSKNPGKYADTAIDEMMRMMKKESSLIKDIEVKISGGADMFPGIEHKGSLAPGRDNISSVRNKFKKENLCLIGEAVGGTAGRSVELSTANGIMTVRIKI